MKALIRKELRELLWPAVIGAAIFAIAVGLGWRYQQSVAPTTLWLIAMPLIGLLLGSQAVAKERAHRTHEWQNLWPATRGQWWWAKLLPYLGVLAVGFALVGLGTKATGPWPSGLPPYFMPLAPFVVMDVGVTVLLFGLGFLMSSLRRTSFEAAGLALLGALVLGTGWYVASAGPLPELFGPRLGISSMYGRPGAVLAIGIALGLACLIAAGWAYFSTVPMSVQLRNLRGGIAAAGLCIVALGCVLVLGLYAPPLGRPHPQGIWDVHISPDGRLIAVSDDCEPYPYRGMYRSNLWVLNANGTGLYCAARGPAVWEYHWLPDSRRLLCVWGLPGRDDSTESRPTHWCWLLYARGGRARKLWPVTQSPQDVLHVSPKGNYLLVGHELYDLRTFRKLADVALPSEAAFAEWTADESAVYVRCSRWAYGGGPRYTDYRIDLPSGKTTRLAPGTHTGIVRKEGFYWWTRSFRSPDGRWLAKNVPQGGTKLTRSTPVDLVVRKVQGGPPIFRLRVKTADEWFGQMMVGWTADDKLVLQDHNTLAAVALDGTRRTILDATKPELRERENEGSP